jgi:hypothetical protein
MPLWCFRGNVIIGLFRGNIVRGTGTLGETLLGEMLLWHFRGNVVWGNVIRGIDVAPLKH